jgi:hypothetical protein
MKRLLEKPRTQWKIILNLAFKVIRWEGMDWIHVVEDRDRT